MHRDIQHPEPFPPRRPDTGAGRFVIAVIGIDRYIAWPRLHTATSDATSVAQLFTQLGFVELTTPLIDGTATGEAMRHLVTDDLAQLTPDDSLVLFFAGHGSTHTAHFGDVSVKTGYIIPVDAAHPGGRVATWVRLDSWLSDIARLPPRHILVIIDACHSGVALGPLVKWRNAAPVPASAPEELRGRRSRRIITSALDDQRAMDSGPYPGHSLFTGCLIEGLSGGLSEGGRSVATGSEIGLYLQQRVSSYPMSTQTPDFGALELDDRGEIVVPLLRARIAPDDLTPTAVLSTSAAPYPLESAESAAVTSPALHWLPYSLWQDQQSQKHAQLLPVVAPPPAPQVAPIYPTAMSHSALPSSTTIELAAGTQRVPPPPSRFAGSLPAVVVLTDSWRASTRVSHHPSAADRTPRMPLTLPSTSTEPAAPPPTLVGAGFLSARRITRPRASIARVATIAGAIAIFGGIIALSYTIAQYAIFRKPEVHRETRTSGIDQPIRPVSSPLLKPLSFEFLSSSLAELSPPPVVEPVPPPAAPTAKIVMQMPPPVNVRAVRDSIIDTIVMDKSMVKAGQVIITLIGYESLESDTDTIELDKYLIQAPSSGVFTSVAMPGQRIAARDVVATIQRSAVPVATFHLDHVEPFTAGAHIKVTVSDHQQRVRCTITEVQSKDIKVMCPNVPALSDGTGVTLEIPTPR